MKKNLVLSAILVMVVMFSFNLSIAFAGDDAANFEKTRALMGNMYDTDKADEPLPVPADSSNPDAPGAPAEAPSAPTVPPASSDQGAPVPDVSGGTRLYYCVIPKAHTPNIIALCNKYNAPVLIYRSFNQLLVLKRVGVVVTVDPKNTYFLKQLKKYYNAKLMKNVSIRVKVNVQSVMYAVCKKAEETKASDFGGCDAILASMIKNPYGHNSTMFKTIAQNFPGLLDKVTVKAHDHWFFGKNKKVLFNPIVTVEMLALNMNGKNKNVTLFHKVFLFKTIKHNASYNWNKI